MATLRSTKKSKKPQENTLDGDSKLATPVESETQRTTKSIGNSWLIISVPIAISLVAAYYGGFLAPTAKRIVPPAHHRASQPKTKPTNTKPLLTAVLDKDSSWQQDQEFQTQSNAEVPTCGFIQLDASDLRPEMFQEGGEFESAPLLIRGLTAKWPAHAKWARTNLIELYGNKSILAGSESSIVYGGGTATLPMRLNTFLASMRHANPSMSDGFAFDVSILDR